MLELNNDQIRELINTRQRFAVQREQAAKLNALRGSMVWSPTKGIDYLIHAYYRPDGTRRQASLGPRSEKTEHIKSDFDNKRATATLELRAINDVMRRQAAVNKALGLGRVPRLSARIIRALDKARWFGTHLRIVGTHALFAYEAAAGVMFDAGLMTTEDVDLLYDSRNHLALTGNDEAADGSLLKLLQSVDHSFTRSKQTYRAVNRDGFLVDLIKPLRNPPWRLDAIKMSADESDLEAVAIEGLGWLESAPMFEAIAIDETGEPLTLCVCDPRAFAAHKLWLSREAGRDPLKRRRDQQQAEAVARLVNDHLPHLPFEADALRMIPKAVFDAAKPLFSKVIL